MYRVISQTGQGFKAHDRHFFQSMRSAWGLRPAPSFVHGWDVLGWGDAREGYNTLYLTKRTHPWRIRTQRRCYSRLLREANSRCPYASRCRSPGCGAHATPPGPPGIWNKHATDMPAARLLKGWRIWRFVRARGGPVAGPCPLCLPGRGALGPRCPRLRRRRAPDRRSRRAPSRKTASAAGFPRWSCGRPGSPARSPGPGPDRAPPRRTPCTPIPCSRYRP